MPGFFFCRSLEFCFVHAKASINYQSNQFDVRREEKMFPSTSNGVIHHHNHSMSLNMINTTSTTTISYANGRYDDVDDYGGGRGCVEHQVSQMDTLAGVAIKYGVEVADIKRMNGLATDLQMYALKSLQIPPLRRHPPAPTWTNGTTSSHGESGSAKKTPHRRRHSSFESLQTGKFTSPQLKVSPAMSTLQNYYGLVETELTLYSTGNSDLHKFPLASESPFNRLNKSRYNGNGTLLENGGFINNMALTDEKSFRRRQKADAEFGFETPEKLIKEENGSASRFFPAISGRGLAPRPKSSTRLAADAESGWLNSTLSAFRDSHSAGDVLSKVHKSLSTSSLQDQENNSSTTWLTSKWNLKQDLQALSAGPIFDGLPLPKPMSGRKKAALD